MTAPTISSIGLGATIGGGVTNAFGALRKGEAEGNMYDYQAGVAEINANIANENSRYAYNKGEMDAGRQGLKSRQVMGQIKAGQAASGLDVNSGSSKDVQVSQDALAHMDQDTIRSNAARTAYDYTVQATMHKNQAGLYRAAGENARSAGKLNAFSSILGTVGSVSSRWIQNRQLGLGTGWGSGSDFGHESVHSTW